MITTRPIEFHPEAIDEARAAREWYAERNLSLGSAFMNELDCAYPQKTGILAAPNQNIIGKSILIRSLVPFLNPYVPD